MNTKEKIIKKEQVELFTENIGNPQNPPMLLIMGASASMTWWDKDFCELLAGKGFFVIRYDNRDVGRSTCYPPGEPPYSVIDMAEDVLTVLDAYNLPKAHLAGMSLGGMLAQLIAIRHPERVLTITAIASSVWDDLPELPQIDRRILDYHASAATLNWENRDEVLRYMVGGWRLLNGSRHPFDEKKAVLLAKTEFDRANNLLSMFNHSFLKGGEDLYGESKKITAPTLIIHGTEDIVLPFAHAEALLHTIPGSTLITLDGGGHEVHYLDWNTIINAIVKHIGKL